jgi:hypothetical protein
MILRIESAILMPNVQLKMSHSKYMMSYRFGYGKKFY